MNPSLLGLLTLCLVASSMAIDVSSNDMEFLNGLPMDAVEEFVNTQLDRTLAKGERDQRMKDWARRQGKKVQRQFNEFHGKVRKQDRDFLKTQARAIHYDFSKQLKDTFFNPSLSHQSVCVELNRVVDKMAARMREIGEKGPRSHTPCSIDKKHI